jgi:competence protein ComEA
MTMININSAPLDQLKTMVGIGDTYAKKIVEGRPYHTKEELLKREILPYITYFKMKECIVTRPQ